MKINDQQRSEILAWQNLFKKKGYTGNEFFLSESEHAKVIVIGTLGKCLRTYLNESDSGRMKGPYLSIAVEKSPMYCRFTLAYGPKGFRVLSILAHDLEKRRWKIIDLEKKLALPALAAIKWLINNEPIRKKNKGLKR